MVTFAAKAFRTVILVLLCSFVLTACWQVPQNNPDRSLSQSATITPVASPPVRLVSDEYVPYTTDGPDDNGFFTQIVKEVFANAGIQAEVEFYPWSRCEQMVADGEAFASFPYGFVKNDANYMTSDAIVTGQHKLFYHIDNPNITRQTLAYTDLSDFKDFVFGATGGYWYGTQADFRRKGLQAEWAADSDALLRMLQSGRIDFVIEDDLVAAEAIGRLFPQEVDHFATLPVITVQRAYHLIISRNYPDSDRLLAQFNESLRELKGTERIRKILVAYGIDENRALPAETTMP